MLIIKIPFKYYVYIEQLYDKSYLLLWKFKNLEKKINENNSIVNNELLNI